MSKLRPLEYIFSITNSGTDKLIMFLGIPIRIDQSKYYREICETLPVQKDKIVFENFNGNSYGCNPKYIAEEIIRRNLPYDLVWLVRSVTKEKEKNVFPEQIRLVGYGSKQALKELAKRKLEADGRSGSYAYVKSWFLSEFKEEYNNSSFVKADKNTSGAENNSTDPHNSKSAVAQSTT